MEAEEARRRRRGERLSQADRRRQARFDEDAAADAPTDQDLWLTMLERAALETQTDAEAAASTDAEAPEPAASTDAEVPEPAASTDAEVPEPADAEAAPAPVSHWTTARSAVASTAAADTFVKTLVRGERSGVTERAAAQSRRWHVLRGRVNATIVSHVFVHSLLDVVEGDTRHA